MHQGQCSSFCLTSKKLFVCSVINWCIAADMTNKCLHLCKPSQADINNSVQPNFLCQLSMYEGMTGMLHHGQEVLAAGAIWLVGVLK